MADLPAEAKRQFPPWKCFSSGAPTIITTLSSTELASVVRDAKLYAVYNYTDHYIGLVPKLLDSFVVEFSYITGHNPVLLLTNVSGPVSTIFLQLELGLRNQTNTCMPVGLGGGTPTIKHRGLSLHHGNTAEDGKKHHLSFAPDSKIIFPPFECTEHRMFDEPVTNDQKVVFATADLLSAVSTAKLINVEHGVHYYQGSVYSASGLTKTFGLGHHNRILATILFSYTLRTATSEAKLELEKVESAWVSLYMSTNTSF